MKPSIWLYVGLFACALSFLGGFLSHRPGPSLAAVQVAHAATKEAVVERAPVAAAFVHRDSVLRKIVAKYDTVRHTFEITDTNRVKALLETCDALRNSCLAFRDTARFLVARDSAVFRAKDREIAAWKAAQPSRFSQFVKYTEVAAIAYTIGRLSPQWKVPVLHLSF